MAKRAHEGEESAGSKRLKLDDIQTLEEAKLELQKSIEENEKLQETIETLRKEMEKMKEMSSNKEANVQDDECLVVIVPPHEPVLEKEKEKSPMKPVVKKEVSGNEDEDEDCVIISTKGPQPSDFPHARAHCTLNKFTQTESVDGMFPINKEHCQNCYCFICEIPANDVLFYFLLYFLFDFLFLFLLNVIFELMILIFPFPKNSVRIGILKMEDIVMLMISHLFGNKRNKFHFFFFFFNSYFSLKLFEFQLLFFFY